MSRVPRYLRSIGRPSLKKKKIVIGYNSWKEQWYWSIEHRT